MAPMVVRKILLADDDEALRGVLSEQLSVNDEFNVIEVGSGREALELAEREYFDALLVDVTLPDMEGQDLCRQLRRAGVKNPIIMLNASDQDAEQILSIDFGANDYVKKSFSPRDLVARINAVLLRAALHNSDERIEFEGLALDQASHRVLVGEKTVPLGPTEYRMLEFFMTHPERVYKRDQLLDRVWGGNVYVEERTIDVHIRRLRKALEEFGYDRFIQTVRGSGYRFSARAE